VILTLANLQYVLLTTSREPTLGVRTLCRELSFTLPNIARINRGKLGFEGIVEKALKLNAEKMIIVSRWKEGFAKIEFFEIKQGEYKSLSPTIYIHSVKFRKSFENQILRGRKIKSVAVAISSKETFELKAFENFISSFFNIPVLSLEEAIDGYDAVMKFFVDSSNEVIVTFEILPEMVEIGPQMKLSYLIW